MAIGSWTLGIESGSFESVRILSCHQSFGCGIDFYSSQYLQLDFSLCQLNRAWMHYFFSKNPAGSGGLRERDGCVFDWSFSFNSPGLWAIPQFHHFEKIVVTMHTTTTTFPGVFFFSSLVESLFQVNGWLDLLWQWGAVNGISSADQQQTKYLKRDPELYTSKSSSWLLVCTGRVCSYLWMFARIAMSGSTRLSKLEWMWNQNEFEWWLMGSWHQHIGGLDAGNVSSWSIDF